MKGKILRIAKLISKLAAGLIASGVFLCAFYYIPSFEPETPEMILPTPEPTPPPDYSVLRGQLEEQLSQEQGDWSLYFYNCATGDEISINSHQVYSASLIKLFVIQAAYQKVLNGALADDASLEAQLMNMITYSDNNAWQTVARRIGGGSYSAGMAYVTSVAAERGFGDTGQFYKGSHRNYNFTSVNDCGAYLRGILDGTIVSPEYSEKILGYLRQQQHLQKLPAGVPEGVETANKTGELEYNQGDAAIVFSPAATYVLVVIGDDLSNSYGRVPVFVGISETVYNFINN